MKLTNKWYLDNIIKMLPGHVYWKDRSGVLLGCNENQALFLGLKSPREIVGKNDYDITTNKRADEISKFDSEVMQSGMATSKEETFTSKEGIDTIFLSKKVPLKDEGGKVVGLVGISFDITKRKQIEQELEDAKSKLEHANKAKSELLSIIDHELRLPVNNVLGIAELLSLEDLSNKQKKYVDRLMSSGGKILPILGYLIDYSNLETGSLKINKQSTNLKLVIEGVINRLADYAREQGGCDILFDYGSVPEQIFCDDLHVSKILDNLLWNAIRFSNKGLITIKVNKVKEKNRQFLEICVKDQGAGMSETQQKHIFSLFAYESGAPTDYSNVGLRLSISKRIADLMDCDLSVTSQLNNGSSFALKIPLEIDKLNKHSEVKAGEWEKCKSASNVSLIDDLKERREFYGKILSLPEAKLISSKAYTKISEGSKKASKKKQVVIIDESDLITDLATIVEKMSRKYATEEILIFILTENKFTSARQLLAKYTNIVFLEKPLIPTKFIQMLENAIDEYNKYVPQILLVEDDLVSQEIETIMLEELGCKVVTAKNGKEAVSKIKDNFDIVFMDLSLPDTSGIDITKKIRGKYGEEIPIIALTAYATDYDQEQCIESGMNDVVNKPISIEKLRNILTNYIPQYQS